MRLAVSEVEFAVLTVLISVLVNDSAPSLGTHQRGWMGEGLPEKDGVLQLCFYPLGLTSNPILLILILLLFSLLPVLHFLFLFLFHKSLLPPPPPHHI